ncbi:unnamed protein product [Prorocentrum cordatum]|uniref:Uncharacterized protein n=1 Tax=Prorocentrum cordatum TaxID=2364126 RepID=A0ABN9SFX5_9DINO|nr:unnamed protein product [Polarella glacialis]
MLASASTAWFRASGLGAGDSIGGDASGCHPSGPLGTHLEAHIRDWKDFMNGDTRPGVGGRSSCPHQFVSAASFSEDNAAPWVDTAEFAEVVRAVNSSELCRATRGSSSATAKECSEAAEVLLKARTSCLLSELCSRCPPERGQGQSAGRREAGGWLGMHSRSPHVPFCSPFQSA